MTNNIFLLAFFFPLGLLALHFAMEYWPRSPEALAQYRYNQLVERWRRRGLSHRQQMDEMKFRMAWECFSRRVSEACEKYPGGYREEIARIAAEEARSVARVDVGVARRFLSVVETSPLEDFLRPAAMAKVNHHLHIVSLGERMLNQGVTAGHIAAFTTRP